MSVALVILVVLIYLGAWRIGSIMLQLTGLTPQKSSFQALSAITQTGFTTREAELIVNHDQRRRIVSFLIIFGHAGFASIIAILAQSLLSKNTMELAWKLVALLTLGVLIYFLAAMRGINERVSQFIRRRLERTAAARPLACEEVLHLAEGYGVAEVHLGPQHEISLAGRNLAQLNLTASHVLVLAIQKGEGSLIPAPTRSAQLAVGDTLICYGRVDRIRELAHHPQEFLITTSRGTSRGTVKPPGNVRRSSKSPGQPR